MRRVPVEHRWSEDNVNWIQWAPWHEYKDCPDADGDVPEGVPVEDKLATQAGERERVVILDTSERIPREFYITHENAKEHGYTRGCPGCSSWFKGLSRQPHTSACRERFRGLMENDARVKFSDQKRK